MAGVYTDNQPDFSFLQPGETKTWSQYWYPIQKIGPAQHANLDAAVSCAARESALPRRHRGHPDLSARPVSPARTRPTARAAAEWHARSCPRADPSCCDQLPRRSNPGRSAKPSLRVLDRRRPRDHLVPTASPAPQRPVPPPATEPPAPRDIASADELFVTGLHLDQYRHATRCPTLYWREALRRDPLDARCNNALGLWHLKRGEFALAEARFRKAIERLTRRNANPADGEPFYNLGLCLRFQADRLSATSEVLHTARRCLPRLPRRRGPG